MKKELRHRRRKKAERQAFGILAGILLVFMGSLLVYLKGQGVEETECIGNVDFSLWEPLGDKLYESGSTIQVVPGQRLAKDPTVRLKDHSAVAYLRIKILLGGLSGKMREELEQGLSVKNGWIKNLKDGYYYYQYPVKEGEEVCFFDTLTVPECWRKSQKEICFCMELKVEAAQTTWVEVQRDNNQKISGWTKIS